MVSRLHVSEWHELPGGWGDALAVQGDHTVAASPAGVWVWEGRTTLRTVVPAGAFAVGAPRLARGLVRYGTGQELAGGGFQALGLPPVPGSPRAAAWTADGTRVAVLWVRGAEGRILELGADGSVVREVWTGSPPPDALWYGAGTIVGIGRQLRAWAADGAHVADAHPGGVAAVSAVRDESRLLTVGWEGTAKLWRTDTWSVISELTGSWAGGAIAPGGEYVLLLTKAGGLLAVCPGDGGMIATGEVPVAGAPVAVALGDGRVVGSFREGARVRAAEVRIRCD